MKKLASALCVVLAAATAMAAPDAYDYDVVHLDRMSRFDARPGEVIVKLKDTASPVRLRSVAGKASSTSAPLNAVMQKYNASEAVQLMPLSGAQVAPRRAKALNGREVADEDLSQLYSLTFEKTANVHEIIEELKALDVVEYAEPNYLMHTLAVGDAGTYTSDPLYSQQWGISAIGLDQLWGVEPISDYRPVIAILDTGVDITHPDLKDNIWINAPEADGAEDTDDDANGFADDIHGWDFVNNSARMRDNNGHGTHCAGIAAASGGNGIGITGANPDALIMPITVMQSDGSGDVATIIRGIDYARANGADLISMSFGSYSNSIALQQALGKAYQKAVLVAAAGNDNKCIYPHQCPVTKDWGMTMFPAAFSFVLGVEASDPSGVRAGFSNFDEDGPIYSTFTDLFNYELRAPGVNIMSTFPGGKYRALSGTSMACPLAAGAISRLMMCKEISTKEELFGDLIHSAHGNMDIFAAYNISDADRKPTLALVTYRLDDEKMGDGDGRPDAGETIRIYPTFRNAWGNARNIKYKVKLAEIEDPEILEFIDSGEAHSISNLSSYASAEAENPFVLKINPNCADGRHICLVLTATCDNISTPLVQEMTFVVENGVELGGILAEDMTLTPDKNYIITNSLAVPDGVTLTILPGTTLKFKNNVGFAVSGNLVCTGEPNNIITFTRAEMSDGYINSFNLKPDTKIAYTIFKNLQFGNGNRSHNGVFYDCIIMNNNHGWSFKESFGDLNRCNIINNDLGHGYRYNSDYHGIEISCNILKNYSYTINHFESGLGFMPSLEYTKSCNILNNKLLDKLYNLYLYSDFPKIVKSDYPSYLGTKLENIAREGVYDIYNKNFNVGFGQIDISNMLTRPVHEAHGIVWKVLVNDYDAQDEYELLPPLGVGRHKFEVYFNRKMNHDKAPMIAMGVRAPYTQTSIAADGSWRTESYDGEEVDIYTAYLDIQGKDNYDGVNTIYVAEAEDDEYFEIPIEDVRFHVNVQSAGSMSEGFAAEPGLGKVMLEWENPEENFDDMLGYNMYRYEAINDSTYTEPIRINESLLTEETLTDFDVVPGHRYCYYYKVMRTDLQENAASKTVAATPLTAAKGDADGSMSVDVLDVVTEVNYMTGQNPQPFIFDAADVNDDTEVDILDVVCTVNIILQPAAAMSAMAEHSANYWIEDGILYLDSSTELAGLQLTFAADADADIKPLAALDGMETAGSRIAADRYRFVAFSISGRTIASGRQALLSVGNANLEEIILSDTAGKRVVALAADMTGIAAPAASQMCTAAPNPFHDTLNAKVLLAEAGNHAVTLTLTALDGAVMLEKAFTLGYGEHSLRLDTSALAEGFYLLTMSVDGKHVATEKLIKR